MKSNLFRILVVISLFVNIGAVYIWGQWFLQTYVVHSQIREFGEEVQGQISATGFHVVYADTEYCIARKNDGSWFFCFKASDETVAVATMKDNGETALHSRTQYLLSAHKFFVGWKRGSDICEDIALQYNDNCKFTDRLGVGEMMAERRDDRLFWTDRATHKTESDDSLRTGTSPLQ